MKSKKSVKKPRTKSAGQIAGRRIGCPGVGMFRLDQLKPADYNPRLIAAEALEGLMNSISRFGCVEPIVVNTRGRKNVIVGGNQRLKALRSLGIHTNTGCICYEPFCGSGSQIIAAEKLDRRCFAMEKEPVFVDVAVERWERWTGTKAKRERK